jgi:hypothetical protein
MCALSIAHFAMRIQIAPVTQNIGNSYEGTMVDQDSEIKEGPKAYSTDEARDNLGPLVLRAGFGEERIPITYHGELRAFLVGPKDVARLRSLDAA